MQFSSGQIPNVLFLGHDAAPHGAQILLLNLLRWCKSRNDLSFEILLKGGGVLESDYGELSACRVWQRPASLKQRLFSLLRSNDLLKSYQGKIDLLYSNTITNGELLEKLAPLGCPVITHVHELENYLHDCGEKNFSLVDRHTDLYIAASGAVRDNLINNHGIDTTRIRVVHSFVNCDRFSAAAVKRPRHEVLKSLNIPADAFVVGGSGTADWRKSPELFVQLAGIMKRVAPEKKIYFLWVGGQSTWHLEYDVKKLGLDTIRFVPHVANTADYYNAFDLFALVSRIDPFPLVCLEAASLCKPVLCFDSAGGMPEFVEADCGFVVPYLDLEAMMARIVQLYDDCDLCRRLGDRGAQKVRERHDVSIAGSEIAAIIQSLTGKS